MSSASSLIVLPTVELATSDAGLRSLGTEWNELVADSTSPSVFSTWEWIGSWMETLGSNGAPWVLAARDTRHGRLVGLAPFVIHKRRWRKLLPYRELSFLGSGTAASDHLDLIVRLGHERSVASALQRAIRRRKDWDVARLDGISPDSPLLALLPGEFGPPETAPITCPYAVLAPNWDQFEAGLGRNLRQNLRRYARQLERAAPGRVHHHLASDPEEVRATLDALIHMHQQVRTGHDQPGAFRDPRMVQFHHLVAQRLLQHDRLRLYSLSVAGRLIAALYCLRYRDVVSFYQSGFDRRWGRFGPGRQLMGHAIRSSIEEGAREFDFLRGDEPYKFQWTKHARTDLLVEAAWNRWGGAVLTARRAGRSVRGKVGRRARRTSDQVQPARRSGRPKASSGPVDDAVQLAAKMGPDKPRRPPPRHPDDRTGAG
ncbi:MAG: GNAT family N-acetyltransferase [Acidimicrobiia bacterium]